MSTVEILRAARDLISDPARWWQGSLSRGDRYCASFACAVAAGDVERVYSGPAYLAIRALDAVVGPGRTIEHVNDTGEHAEVLAVFDAAIEAEKAKVRS